MKITHRNSTAKWSRTLANISLALCFICTPCLQASEVSEAYGRDEAAMWRAYYEGRWLDLATRTAELAQRQFGVGAEDAIRLSGHAAKAAMLFRKDGTDPEVTSELEKLYTIVRDAGHRNFDPAEAARLELQWWRERREGKTPEQYALTIARAVALVFGSHAEKMQPAALLRARAMAYRDERRDGRMTEADWQEVARQLAKAREAMEPGR
jgi:hypothetical protein